MRLIERGRFVQGWWAVALVAVLLGCDTNTGDQDLLVREGNRGAALMGRFDYDGAREVFTALADRVPDNPDVLVNLAIATLNRQKEGDEARAFEILERALDLDPDHLRARYCRGLLEFRAGRAEAALEDFRAVVAADPTDADAAFFAGQCQVELGRLDEALASFERAIVLDPYLRSASYRAFQTLQRLGRNEDAAAALENFQSLENNPRGRLVEFKYTRMGRRAEVRPFDRRETEPAEPPEGPLFAAPIGVDLPGPSRISGASEAAPAPSVTVCDINGDGRLDLFVAALPNGGSGITNAVVYQEEGGRFVARSNHPLAAVPDVRAAVWGDVDNDGLTDVYLCRRGPNQLWRALGGGRFEDVTEAAGVGGGDRTTVDGAMIDADHDGDLDLFLVNADGPNELFNNDRDGGFRPLAADRGLTGAHPQSKGVLFADLDADRDADLIVLGPPGHHEVLTNDLLWTYRAAEDWAALRRAEILDALPADANGDGRMDVLTLGSDGEIAVWEAGPGGRATSTRLAGIDLQPGPTRMALTDLDGDGGTEVLVQSGRRLDRIDPATGAVSRLHVGQIDAWALAVIDPGAGPSLVTWSTENGLTVHPPGPGRYPFAAVTVTGQDDQAAALRSNASGVGTQLAFRVGPRWVVTSTFRRSSGPGQSLQPVPVGLGGAPAIDFVALEWSDGVYQTEMQLEAGRLHRIVETQRQLSSCPVLFAWDGREYRFVSDLLGVGGIGFAVGPGEYGVPRPWEHFLMPSGLLAERQGRFILKVGEPMEEATYLDAARLVAYDLPDGWSVVPDDRMGILGPEPTGDPLFYRRGAQPAQAVNQDGTDVTGSILEADLRGAPVGALDRRFIGMLEREHVLDLRFDRALDGMGDRLALVVDGWIEYPYSQTAFAAWQAGAAYQAPTLEARAGDGPWVTVLEQWGYPAGMPRRASVPLPPLPPETDQLRLRTNQEIYWDRIEVVSVEPCPEARRLELPLLEARLLQSGFAQRTTGDQHRPHYDYSQRAPVWDTRSQQGWYTRLGEVTPLLAEPDGATATFGPGEEVELVFGAPESPPAPGFHRSFIFESEGWCKDMDLYTKDGSTLEPLPGRGRGGERRAELLATFNTRFRQGRD